MAKFTKKPKRAAPAPQPYRTPAGLSEKATDQLVAHAETLDRGTSRHPWPAGLAAKAKAAIEGLKTIPDCEKAINALVVAELGGGLHGRGPFA